MAACRRDGKGPAHWAARHGRTAVLRRLLELGVEGGANARTANGTSMLMLACYGGHVAAAELLRQRGQRAGWNISSLQTPFTSESRSSVIQRSP